jgi:hypothetical protein
MRHHGKASPTPATHDRIKGYLFEPDAQLTKIKTKYDKTSLNQ